IVNQRGYRFCIIAIVSKLIGNVASFDVAEVAHPAHEFLAIWIVIQGSGSDVSDAGSLPRLLRARRQRPRGYRAAEHRDELAPLHSITSSASASSAGGTVRPSILAVSALMTSSNLVGCTTGKSAILAPLTMRPV